MDNSPSVTTERVRLTVLMGLPASGKTTWAQRESAGQTVFSTDRMRLDGLEGGRFLAGMRRAVDRALGGGRSVVVDACSLDRRQRLAWLALAGRHGAWSRLVVLDTPFPVCRRRNALRASGMVPEVSMGRYRARWAVSLREALSEPWDERTVVTSGASSSGSVTGSGRRSRLPRPR